MFCEECGTKNELGATFCESCGHKMPVSAPKKEKGPKRKLSKSTIIILSVIGVLAACIITFFIVGSSMTNPKNIAHKYFKESGNPVLDLFNGEIITYTIGSSPTYSLVSEMLEKALERLPEEHKLLMHSDQGWHYRHKQYVQMLKDKGIRQSMSHKGNCYDNAVMENFFGHLKSELLYLQEFESMEHFKQELIEYIDYYNNKRIKARLKGLPPALHRQQALSAA